MMRLVPYAIVAALVSSCAPSRPPQPSPPALASSVSPSLSDARAPVAASSALRVRIRPPATFTYETPQLGRTRGEVLLDVSNDGTEPVDLSTMTTAFAVAADGVTYPCDDVPHGEWRDREPSTLAPGRMATLVRELACWTPVPGRYDVQVFFGRRDGRAPEAVGRFSLDVEPLAAQAPVPLPSRPGIVATMAGEALKPPSRTKPVPCGVYCVIVALVNTGHAPVQLGPAHLQLRAYHKGATWACAGQAQAFDLPPVLRPGAVHLERFPVTCLGDVEGEYDVVGLVTFDDRPLESTPIGRVSVRITSDPSLLWPPTP